MCSSRVEGHLAFEGNPVLATVSGFGSLVTLGNHLDISLNPELENIDGFVSLAEVGAEFYVAENPSLPTCDATDLADHLTSFGGGTCIYGNQADTCDDDTSGCP